MPGELQPGATGKGAPVPGAVNDTAGPARDAGVEDAVPSAQGDFVVRNSLGMHVRSAASFVRLAQRYRAEITVAKDGTQVNGKSILGLTSLMATQGSTLRIGARGVDAPEAVRDLGALVDAGFGEE